MQRTAQNWNEVSPRFESQRSAHYRSTVIETLKWFCSELDSSQITSALEDLFSEAPSCKLIRLGLNSDEQDDEFQQPSLYVQESAIECNETPFYSETSAAPCTLVHLEIAGQSLDGAPWEAKLQLAVSAESADVWQTILRSISAVPTGEQLVAPRNRETPEADDTELRPENDAVVVGSELMAIELAHLLRNPLGSIMAAAGLLSDCDESAKESENAQLLDIIQSQSARIDKMLRDHVLACEEPQTKWTRVNLVDILRDSAWGSSDNPGVPRIAMSLPPQEGNDESSIIKSDRSLLLQLFRFLMTNIPMKLTGCESLSVRIRRTRSSALVQLEYNGNELRPEILRMVVLPFSATKEGGSGLDVAPVHGILSALRGEVSVAPSKLGTVLTVTIPVNQSDNRNNKCER